MTPRLLIEPLTRDDVAELEAVLRHEDVYRFIGGTPNSERFRLRAERAVAGPPEGRSSETWLNLGVRLRGTGELIGRLEATIHDGIAEVAFLFGPPAWGQGYATEGLRWLHAQLAARSEPPALWATTVPGNTRCQALLRRCGYVRAEPEAAPRLFSYDPGDLVFTLPRAHTAAHLPSRRSG